MKQKTINNKVNFTGVGLHSGVNVNIELIPTKENNGIVFSKNNILIEALYNNVIDTKLGTTVAKNNEKVLTIEHLMASIWACDIDNLIINIDNQETPIMDGSANIFIKEIEKAGVKELAENRKFVKILKKIEVFEDDKLVSIEPANSFSVDITTDYNYGKIGKENYFFDGKKETFLKEVAIARTFCQEKEIEYMRSIGLARGGSLDNAMVFNDNGIVNNNGFRCQNEVVKHKLLDCIGDLYTSGYNIIGKVISIKGGHTLNNLLLKKLFEDKNNFEIV